MTAVTATPENVLLLQERELLQKIKHRINGTTSKNYISILQQRENEGALHENSKTNITQTFIPKNLLKFVSKCRRRIYGGFFSPDGTLFFNSEQEDVINIFQTDKCLSHWKLMKSVPCRNVNWTVTDMSLSPDQRLLAYSSITSLVHLVGVQDTSTFHQTLPLGTQLNEGFGIWSVRFSPDGTELLAGSANNAIILYDMVRQQVVQSLRFHLDDVNAVSFMDDGGNIFVSGSDDSFCLVWDRRVWKNHSPVGILAGHLDGITYVSPKGDGVYFISNSKDQTIKLWDTRSMTSIGAWDELVNSRPRRLAWDYRWMDYPRPVYATRVHKKDTSLRTFVGHQTLKTLIRCRFSPLATTGQRYVYCGSHNGCVYIYDIVSGDTVSELEGHKSIVRDVDWHPYLPVLVSSSWDGTSAMWCSHPWNTSVSSKGNESDEEDAENSDDDDEYLSEEEDETTDSSWTSQSSHDT
eukprot:jgi/Galph1/3546/GphlegSOOS_G2201.1